MCFDSLIFYYIVASTLGSTSKAPTYRAEVSVCSVFHSAVMLYLVISFWHWCEKLARLTSDVVTPCLYIFELFCKLARRRLSNWTCIFQRYESSALASTAMGHDP